MRISIIGTMALAALVLAGCGRSGDSAGASAKNTQPDCGDQAPGLIYGAPSTTNIVDQIVNSAGPGKPTSLKLTYAAGLGVCIDGATGDIHLYGDKASGATITLTFAGDLTGQAAWPSDPSQAIRVSETAGGAAVAPPATSWNPPPVVSGNGAILIFTVPYEKGHEYYYRLQYVGPGGVLEVVEPRIINH